MKKSELVRLVRELQARVENLESGEIWTDALLEDLSPRVRKLEAAVAPTLTIAVDPRMVRMMRTGFTFTEPVSSCEAHNAQA